MNTSSNSRLSWIKSFAFTTLFCVLIAITTHTIWGGGLTVNLAISFGFGYSAVGSSFILVKLFKRTSRRLEVAISMVVAMTFGTLNAHYWLNGYFGSNISDLKSVVLLGVIFCSVCYYYFYSREKQLRADNELEVAKRRQADQEKVVVLSQLKQLQSQIEPHFLFNTLATINVLIESDSAKAKLMLEKLTDLLRVTLKNSRTEQSTIAQEVDLLDAYLNIQKIRLDERLAFSIETHDISDQQMIPPFLVQPLVENALTHGIEPKAAGGQVNIRITQQAEQLKIEVADNGAGLKTPSVNTGHGVGLSNIRQRIETLYGDKASLTITEQASGGVVSTILLPNIRETSSENAEQML
ncbi:MULTISPECIES: sensor histidine kinase [unclassified Vibrio]|uniref:sensor histidine kinase n=1 Tax=unclassified Vibrio TaxID=2614977 RepID=UPI00159E7508|nr:MULTISPECIES: histidine kinase [unclassified Vibrio]NVN80035.1 sensor histidine kinase [Vibrio sp. Scap16]QLE94576.1 sensor histidine kinase [Vibrio sp. Scap24]